MKYEFQRNRLKCLLVLVLLIPAWTYAKPPSRDLIIFGDSLSDAGNFFTALGEFVQAPFEPIPDAPYATGGHHFSNGRTWVQQLARTLHTPTSSGPALAVSGAFTNYAFGRARARMNAPVFPLYDLGQQVTRFMDDFGGVAPATATYVVFIGSNDVRDALEALADDPGQMPFSGGLPVALEASLEPHRDELASLGCPLVGELDLVRTVKGRGGYDHR